MKYHISTDQQDAGELARFGYKQQLQRSLGSFSSFAIAFSLISISTGIFANFRHGFVQVGPGIVWSWLVVMGGQTLVVLVMSRLAVSFPIAGYGYQWSARLVNPHFGFFTGWLLLVQFLTGFPVVCSALASARCAFIWPEGALPMTVAWITKVVILLVALIHLFGMRLAAWLNNTGVYAELTGVIAITIALYALLDWRGVNLSKLAGHGNFSSGQSAGFSAFALSLLMGAWCLTGFEAAADLAEETHDPRRTVPRAMLTSLLGSGLLGFLLLVGIVLSIDDVRATQGQDSPLISVLQERFGPHWLLAALVVVAVSIFACAIASMAAASRLLFSLSRDGMLPGARWLSRIDPHRSTPRNAVILVWLLSTAIVLLLRQTDLISSVSAVAGYLGYAGIILATLLAGPLIVPGRGWTLLRWLALMWALSLVMALTVPPTDIPGWNDKYLPAKATAFALLAGSAVYFGLIKRRIREGLAGPPQLSDKGSETRP